MALRELLLIAIVAALCIAGLFRPRIALYGYLWFAVSQPDVMAFCPEKYPFSLALAMVCVIGLVRYLPQLPILFRLPSVMGLLVLQIPLALSVVFCEGPFLAPDRYSMYMRTMLIAFLIPLFTESARDLIGLFLTFAISQALFGSRFGVYGFLHGGHGVEWGYSGYDNNETAMAITILIPICWYARDLVSKMWMKLALLVIMLSATPAVIMTNSRGSSLALGTVAVLMIFRSKHMVAMLVVVAIAIGPAIYLVQEQYFNRMSTLGNYEEEASAANRVVVWQAALRMSADYPILGVGFGQRNYQEILPRYFGREEHHAVHNTYIQMLVDSGIFAILIYAGMLIGAVVSLGLSLARVRKTHPRWSAVPIGLQTSLIAFMVGGTFYSMQRWDLPYFLLMMVAAWHKLESYGSLEERGERAADLNLAMVGAEA
jgi:probable O-glycosylation ligase (exosortase A-associated)